MKKNLVRIMAFILVALLALSILPLGALAAGVDVDVYKGHTDAEQPKGSDVLPNVSPVGTVSGTTSVTIKTNNYDKYVIHPNGDDYDLKGIVDLDKLLADPDRKLDPKSSMTFTQYANVLLVYVPHGHRLSRWYSDGTTHWRECLVCHENFIYQNWCQDGDEDEICNICGGDVPYHDVTVIEEEGGKIVVNRDTASHRTKITADVEVNEGYKLKKLHFTKVRENGTRQEITRNKHNGQFWTYMPTYELEVSAEFVKK